jgi:hypothetical protein
LAAVLLTLAVTGFGKLEWGRHPSSGDIRNNKGSLRAPACRPGRR